MKITVEKRNNNNGLQSIRLVYRYGSRTNADGKLEHDRKLELLDLFLYQKSKSKAEKQHNKETLQLVDNIKAKRLAEAASGQHGFTDTTKSKASFYAFFEQVMNDKPTATSSANYKLWQACLIHLKRHAPDERLKFEQINKDWLDGVRHYFDTQAKTKSGNLISA